LTLSFDSSKIADISSVWEGTKGITLTDNLAIDFSQNQISTLNGIENAFLKTEHLISVNIGLSYTAI
jgi:hypothetical protein